MLYLVTKKEKMEKLLLNQDFTKDHLGHYVYRKTGPSLRVNLFGNGFLLQAAIENFDDNKLNSKSTKNISIFVKEEDGKVRSLITRENKNNKVKTVDLKDGECIECHLNEKLKISKRLVDYNLKILNNPKKTFNP